MLCTRLPKPYRPALRLHRALHGSPPQLATLGLRAEDPARKWERRAALSPEAVKTLVGEGHEVLVERCAKRAIPASEYEQVSRAILPSPRLAQLQSQADLRYRCSQVGATLVDQLEASRCDIVVGVKEPVQSSLPSSASSTDKPHAHLAFFHCHKGQSYNFSLLRTLLDSSKAVGTSFIDYELLTSPSKGSTVRSDPTIPSAPPPAAKRTIGFGSLAGYSGMADGLAQLGTKLLAAKGVPSPFLSLVRPLQAGRTEKIKHELERVGREVGEGKLSGMDGPVRRQLRFSLARSSTADASSSLAAYHHALGSRQGRRWRAQGPGRARRAVGQGGRATDHRQVRCVPPPLDVAPPSSLTRSHVQATSRLSTRATSSSLTTSSTATASRSSASSTASTPTSSSPSSTPRCASLSTAPRLAVPELRLDLPADRALHVSPAQRRVLGAGLPSSAHDGTARRAAVALRQPPHLDRRRLVRLGGASCLAIPSSS